MRKVAITCILAALFYVASACNEKRPSPSGPKGGSNIDGVTEDEAESGPPQMPKRIENSFPSQVAGGFYTDEPDLLRKQIRVFLDNSDAAQLLPGRDVVAILSPHAGYKYSGPVAGEAFRLVEGRGYKTVVVLALNHRRSAQKAAVLLRPAYDTPLGSIEISQGIARKLISNYPQLFAADDKLFMGEHSLEVQLPFIQVALPKAKLVPIIMAVRDMNTLGRVGAALGESLGKSKDVLFVVSSDLSHHFPYEQAKKFDDKNLSLIEQWKIPEWIENASKGKEGMCGFAPVLTLINMFERYPEQKRSVLRVAYKNSGDTAGDKSSVVGYGALAFSVEKDMRNESSIEKEFGPYGLAERRELMQLAKKSVEAAAKGEQLDPPEPKSDLLKKTGAAFVTLKKHGDLRGCIGHVIGRIPLYECVFDVAKSATIHDHRFPKVTPDELPDLSFEISILTAPEPIKPEDVVVGRDGLIMSRGGRSGLLLPQVPIEWGWDREEFLAHTCRKASLPIGCWKEPDTEIKAFRAIVFGEDDL